MKVRQYRGKQSRRFWLITLIVIIVVTVVGVGALRVWYDNNLRPVSSSYKAVYFTVETGSSKNDIANGLKNTHLIRNAKAFETYLKSNEIQILQAGTYTLSPSMSVQQIVQKMVNGEVTKNLLTILPGKRLDEVEGIFSKAGYTKTAIETAFSPATYKDIPMVAGLPNGASLEGFLYPDSFQKQIDTPASTIIRESLTEMQDKLTPNIVNGFRAQGLTTFQGVTLASIVYQETDNPQYEPTVAQVFLSRIRKNMNLQSNVTANYAADTANKPRNVNIKSPYNTYLHPGLTPGPISNVTDFAMQAVAQPSNTDYLYFVAGDDKKVHFSHTADEHEAAIKQFCPDKCAQ